MTAEAQEFRAITLDINATMQTLLEERGILQQEVQMTIHHGENGGARLFSPEEGVYLAKRLIGDVNYFVVYRADQGHGYRVETAYCCKSVLRKG